MSNEERTHRYAMMGVVSYIQERISMYAEKNDGKRPEIIILGKLEWTDILGCAYDEDFSVAGIPVIPNLTKFMGVDVA
jgi:hypothetical protein